MSLGFLPFQSGDGSVLIEHPLTSKPTLESIGAGSDSSVGTMVFDSVLGVKSDGASYLRYRDLSTLLASGIESEGQSRIEVEAPWGCVLDPTSGSPGYNPAATEVLAALRPLGGTDADEILLCQRGSGAGSSIMAEFGVQAPNYNMITGEIDQLKLHELGKTGSIVLNNTWNPCFEMAFTSGGTYRPRVGDTILGQTSGNSAVLTAIFINSGTFDGANVAGKFIYESQTGPFTAAEVLDIGANVDIATVTADGAAKLYIVQGVDDVPMMHGTRDDDLSEPSKDLWLCALAASSFSATFFMRNITIANERATFDISERIVLWGTSQSRTAQMSLVTIDPDYSFQQDVRDNSPAWNYLREAARNGEFIQPQNLKVQRYPGFFVSDTFGSPNNLVSTLPVLLGEDPTKIIAPIGTNDAISNLGVPADFQSSLDGIVSAINAHPSVTDFDIANVRSFVADTSEDNPQERGQRDDTVNPALLAADAGLIDAYTLDGAENPGPFTFLGQFGGGAGLNADFHIAANGGFLEGRQYYYNGLEIPPSAIINFPDLINLLGDVVGDTDIFANMVGYISIGITWDQEIPSGLSESFGVVSGTVTTPTNTSIASITATNPFGTIIEKFQWTTLTIGAASNINVTIND